MSISSVSSSPWWPTQAVNGSAPTTAAAATGAASTTAAQSGAAPSGIAPSGTATTASGQPSAPSNPVQQLSAELQSFLLQLQGGAGNGAATAQAGMTGATGTQAVPGADPAGTGKVSGGHHHHHHGSGGTSGVAEAGTASGANDAGPAASASSSGSGQSGAATSNGGNTLQSLATDIARALQSYSSGASAGLASSAMAAQSAIGLAA